MNKYCAGLFLTCFCLLFSASCVKAQEPLQISLFPDRIAIDTFYNGIKVAISGTLPADCEVIIRVTGDPIELKMKKKGKVFGLLWMNRETVTFESTPEAFLLYTAKKFDDLLDGRQKDAPVWQLGMKALQNSIIIKPGTADRDVLLGDLMKLKEKEGFYVVQERVHYTQLPDSRKKFESELTIPPKLPPGMYKVETYAVRSGEIISRYEHPLSISLESFPKLLSTLAFQHGALYGILAAVIAIAAGLLSGLLFRGGKGAH